MTVKQALAELVEELAPDLRCAYTRALVTGTAEDVRKAQAAEMLMSRVYGKPLQSRRLEPPTVAYTLHELEALSLDELADLARETGIAEDADWEFGDAQ